MTAPDIPEVTRRQSVGQRVTSALSIVSPIGWLTMASAVVAGTVGWALGWRELLAVAIMAVVVLAIAVVFVIGRSHYAVTVALAGHRVRVGERAVGEVVVRNTSQRMLLPAEIELPVGQGLAAFPLPRLAGGASHEDVFTIPTDRRAVVTIGPVRSARFDAFALLRREVIWTEPITLYVHPRTVALTGAATGFLKDLEGTPSRELSVSDVSFHALRDYMPGDDRRHIHWKSTARTGRLMVRQFEETRRSHLALALSVAAVDFTDPDEFELAVSVAGSLGLQAFREERAVTAITQVGPLHSALAPRLLDDLSGVQLREISGDVIDLARQIPSEVPNASVAILVCGSSVNPNQLQGVSMAIPIDVRGLCIQCVPGLQLARRVVGNLTILQLGDLDDLPRGMRRVAA